MSDPPKRILRIPPRPGNPGPFEEIEVELSPETLALCHQVAAQRGMTLEEVIIKACHEFLREAEAEQ